MRRPEPTLIQINPPAHRSDAELIVASRNDPDAFRTLYDRWAAPLLGYLLRRVPDPEVAADLLAETFAVAYEQRAKFRDVGRPGGAWLYGIARREVSHYARRARVELRAAARLGLERPLVDDESQAMMRALLEDDPDRAAALSTALAGLSDAERAAVQLRVVDALPYHEVAMHLSCSEEAARTRVHRGLARLATHMEVPDE
jgi:RNA polymerase sigma factor (sigma-70 family)